MNCDKTLKFELGQNSETLILTTLKLLQNPNCDQNQNGHKTEIVTSILV